MDYLHLKFDQNIKLNIKSQKIKFLDKKFNRTDFLTKCNTNDDIFSMVECDFIDE